MNRRTPALFAISASRMLPSRLISRVHPSLRLPIGSLLRAARWMTASKPWTSAGVNSRKSFLIVGMGAKSGTSVQPRK